MAFIPGFDAKSVARIRRVVRKVESMAPAGVAPSQDSLAVVNQPEVQFVQCVDVSGVVDSGITRYKGRVEDYDVNTDAITLFPVDPDYVWLVFENDFTPSTGESYIARRQADRVSDDRPVFRIEGGAGGSVSSDLLTQWVKYTSTSPSGTDSSGRSLYAGNLYTRHFASVGAVTVGDANDNNGLTGVFYMALYDPTQDAWYTNLFPAVVACVDGAPALSPV